MVRLVVMAAGQATRMGQDKLLLPWQGRTVLGAVLQTVLEAVSAPLFIDTEIFVVARRPVETYLTAEQIRRLHSSGGIWREVSQPRPLAETIQTGLEDLREDMQYVGFLPGDQVGVTVSELAACLTQLTVDNPPDFLTPVVKGQPVSPVFFQRQYVPELLSLEGERGGREILRRYPKLWRKYPVEESFAQDLDTPEQYEILSARYREAGKK